MAVNPQVYVVQQFAVQVMAMAFMANMASAMSAMMAASMGYSLSRGECPEMPRFTQVPDDEPLTMTLKDIFAELKWLEEQRQRSLRVEAENNKIAIVLRRVYDHVRAGNIREEIWLAKNNLQTLGRYYQTALRFAIPLNDVMLAIEDNRPEKAEGIVRRLLDCIAESAHEIHEFREAALKREDKLDKQRKMRVAQLLQMQEKARRRGKAGPSWYESLRGEIPGISEEQATQMRAELEAKRTYEAKMEATRKKLRDLDRMSVEEIRRKYGME